MKTYRILIPFLFLFSCTDDKSAYLPQEKEEVNVDQVENEQGENDGEEDILPEGKLVPGVHLVRLNVKEANGETVERRFKYFMPVSIDASRPIPLIFEFHGNMGLQENPLAGISTDDSWAQHAVKENCVICYPAGMPETDDKGEGTIGWQGEGYERSLPFVDSIIAYFKGRTPAISPDRIYSTGQSSGAIFSFELAFKRSAVFAAITPRAGQMSLANETQFPGRAVPVRLFLGTDDDIVNHDGAIGNMSDWAEKIGGYFKSDMVFTENALEIKDYKKVDTRTWKGGRADYEIYSLKEENHNIAQGLCIPYMWEFMAAHTLGTETALFVNASRQDLTLQCGERVCLDVNYSDGAELTIKEQPQGWTFNRSGKRIQVTAPADYYGDIDRSGRFTLEVSLGGQTAAKSISYELTAPKNFFEVGDIYYNDKFEPVGVVCWVNKADIREAKIININEQGNTLYCGNSEGLGLSFSTPDKDNGEENTRRMAEANSNRQTPYTGDAAFLWATNLEDKGEKDWYLPAINELKEMDAHLKLINEAIRKAGGTELKATYEWSTSYELYSSTTEMENGADRKTVYSYDFTAHAPIANKDRNAGGEYFGYVSVRAMKRVSKK